MRLSKNFYLNEFTKSETAVRKSIENIPSKLVTKKLKTLCTKVLQPLRNHYKKPLTVLSGYRSPRLNKAIGGSFTSQHCKGEAADIEFNGIDNAEVAQWIAQNLSFDQLILEFYNPVERNPNSGWIHVSYQNQRKNRNQMLRAQRKGQKVYYYPIQQEFFV